MRFFYNAIVTVVLGGFESWTSPLKHQEVLVELQGFSFLFLSFLNKIKIFAV